VTEREKEKGTDPGKDASTRSPFERPIALAAPFLDLLLWAGERISRLAEPVDHEHYPVRNPREGEPGQREDRKDEAGGDR